MKYIYICLSCLGLIIGLASLGLMVWGIVWQIQSQIEIFGFSQQNRTVWDGSMIMILSSSVGLLLSCVLIRLGLKKL